MYAYICTYMRMRRDTKAGRRLRFLRHSIRNWYCSLSRVANGTLLPFFLCGLAFLPVTFARLWPPFLYVYVYIRIQITSVYIYTLVSKRRHAFFDGDVVMGLLTTPWNATLLPLASEAFFPSAARRFLCLCTQQFGLLINLIFTHDLSLERTVYLLTHTRVLLRVDKWLKKIYCQTIPIRILSLIYNHSQLLALCNVSRSPRLDK